MGAKYNRVYRLKPRTNSPNYVYCLAISSNTNKYNNRKCVGVIMHSPNDANMIFRIISDSNYSYNGIIATLSKKYGLVFFWSLEIESEYGSYNYFNTLSVNQEADDLFTNKAISIPHYTQFTLNHNLYKKIKSNFKKKNSEYSSDYLNESASTGNMVFDCNGFTYKKINQMFLLNIYNSAYYVFCPISIDERSKNGEHNVSYIGIVLSEDIEQIKATKKSVLYKRLLSYLTCDTKYLKNLLLIRFDFADLISLKKSNYRIDDSSINANTTIKEFADKILSIYHSITVFNPIGVSIEQGLNGKYAQINYGGINIPNFFDFQAEFKNNCYVKYNTGEIGFLIKVQEKPVCLKFKIPSVTPNFKTVAVNSLITVNVTKWYSIDDIQIYGKNDDYLAKKIHKRITLLSIPIEKSKFTLNDFFFQVSELKDNTKIKALYEKISNAYPFTQTNYDSFQKNMKYLLNYIENPQLLTSPSLSNTNTESETHLSSNYDYTDYKGTNGVFYTLNSEAQIIGSDVSLRNIQANFVRKFAYVFSSEELKRMYSMMIVDVDLESSRLCIECYGKQKENYSFNIKVTKFSFDFISSPKGKALSFARIITSVCNKIFMSYKHNPSNTFHSSSKRSNDLIKSKSEIVFLDKKETTINVRKTSADYEEALSTSSPKDIHIRRGHWHYYWYGHRNSPERYRKLKWINETIVNRNANIVVIQL